MFYYYIIVCGYCGSYLVSEHYVLYLIVSFNPCDNIISTINFILHLRKLRQERLENLPKVTQLIWSRFKI